MSAHGLSGDYTLDAERSRIGFTARHALVSKVRGRFGDLEGRAHLDFGDPNESWAEVTIQVASIDTANGPRDQELRVNGFLDAPTYPTITFTTTRVAQIGSTSFDVTGDLTIKATTHERTMRFHLQPTSADTTGAVPLRFTSSTSINRRDWKVEWAAPLETGGLLVGDQVAVDVDVTAIKIEAS